MNRQFELQTWAFGATWEQASEAKYNSTLVLLDYLYHNIFCDFNTTTTTTTTNNNNNNNNMG